MKNDLGYSNTFGEIEKYFLQTRSPAFGKISGATDFTPYFDASRIAFTGSILGELKGKPRTCIAVVETNSGIVTNITEALYNESYPQWSPDGQWLAYLSEKNTPGTMQFCLRDGDLNSTTILLPSVPGTIEYLKWRQDSKALLLGVAGFGAEKSGPAGSGASTTKNKENVPNWTPEANRGFSADEWRSIWIYDLETNSLQQISRYSLNIWEASWAGQDAVAAIASDQPSESSWFKARLVLIDVNTGQDKDLYRSEVQIALPAVSPSGHVIAIAEELCSDREVLAGEVLLFDEKGELLERLDTHGVEVTHLVWRNNERLFFAGIRGLDSVYGEYDMQTHNVTEFLSTRETSGSFYPSAVPFGDDQFTMVRHSYTRYYEIAIFKESAISTVVSFSHEGCKYLNKIGGELREVSWIATDGVEIQALLVVPKGPGPHPLILHVHGGPSWAVHSCWELNYHFIPLLVSRGYAVLSPNARGSTGRGKAFADEVFGDMGGIEAQDYFVGLDALVEQGLADPTRLGVIGRSHGGYMASWLITQSNRFAAAVPLSPITNWVSQRYTSNISYYTELVLKGNPTDPNSDYFTCSPIFRVTDVKTPTLLIVGEEDRCTPPSQSVEFYGALQEQGIESAIAIYPAEGHGVRTFPGIIDYCTRVVNWFEEFMPPKVT